MLKIISIFRKSTNFCYFSTKLAEKTPSSKNSIITEIENDVNGMTVVSINPKIKTISKLAAVFNAGSRYECYETRGALGHMLRRAAGLSCGGLTAVSVTRHIQQMGAYLRCVGSRETVAYCLDFPYSVLAQAGELLSHVSTRQQFYSWELSENVKPLMVNDIEYLNRRDFDSLCCELVHKAAFKDTLGNSLFADKYNVGDWNIEKIEDFLDYHFIASKSMLVGISVKHEHLIGLAEKFKIRPLKERQIKETKFRGGELRCELPTEFAKVCVVWETAGSNNIKDALATSLLSYSIDNEINNRIKWNNGNLELIKKITKDNKINENCVANSVNYSYSDRGLLGFTVTGAPDIMNDTVSVLHSHFLSLGDNGVIAHDFDIAKTLLVNDLHRRSESDEGLLENIIGQACSTNDLLSIDMLIDEVNRITLEDVNTIAKSVLSSNKKKAMASVGDLSTVPYLEDLNK